MIYNINITFRNIYVFTSKVQCFIKDTYPLPKSCQTKCIVYQANIDCGITGYKQKCYLDSCETTFKDRFGNLKKSFNDVKHKNDTELSKEFWEIKNRSGTPKIMEDYQNMSSLLSKQ